MRLILLFRGSRARGSSLKLELARRVGRLIPDHTFQELAGKVRATLIFLFGNLCKEDFTCFVRRLWRIFYGIRSCSE